LAFFAVFFATDLAFVRRAGFDLILRFTRARAIWPISLAKADNQALPKSRVGKSQPPQSRRCHARNRAGLVFVDGYNLCGLACAGEGDRPERTSGSGRAFDPGAWEGVMLKIVTTAIAAAVLLMMPHLASAQTASTTAKETATQAHVKKKKPPSHKMTAARERQKKCGTEWKEAKAAGKVQKGMTWPKYWSACNKRLKAGG
jgi:hypothetical protein